MSGSRLTEKQVLDLRLIGTDWATVKKFNIREVYIRAHADSPAYGPYRVVNAKTCTISKQDGSMPRDYPRDKGLLVQAHLVPPQVSLSVRSVPVRKAPKELITELIEDIQVKIQDKERELEKLYIEYETFRTLLERVESDG